MHWLRKLSGSRRASAGLEWWLWRKLPAIGVIGTLVPLLVLGIVHLVNGADSSAQTARMLQTANYTCWGGNYFQLDHGPDGRYWLCRSDGHERPRICGRWLLGIAQRYTAPKDGIHCRGGRQKKRALKLVSHRFCNATKKRMAPEVTIWRTSANLP